MLFVVLTYIYLTTRHVSLLVARSSHLLPSRSSHPSKNSSFSHRARAAFRGVLVLLGYARFVLPSPLQDPHSFCTQKLGGRVEWVLSKPPQDSERISVNEVERKERQNHRRQAADVEVSGEQSHAVPSRSSHVTRTEIKRQKLSHENEFLLPLDNSSWLLKDHLVSHAQADEKNVPDNKTSTSSANSTLLEDYKFEDKSAVLFRPHDL
eukprot:764083-Hanusia_phi.AAC.2